MTDTLAPAQAPDDFWVTKNKDLMIGGGRSQGYAWSPKAKSMSGVHGRLRAGVFLYLALQVATVLTLIGMMYAFWTFQSGSEIDAPMLQTLAMMIGLSGMYLPIAALVVTAICVILYSMFVYRGMKNLHLSNVRSVQTSPGWAVGWSFIPFANLRMIFNVMKQIWVGSQDPVAGRFEPPATIILWWGCWLASGVIGRISNTLAPNELAMSNIDRTELLSAFTPTVGVGLVAEAFGIVSCFCLMSVIKQITTAQETLRSTSAFDE